MLATVTAISVVYTVLAILVTLGLLVGGYIVVLQFGKGKAGAATLELAVTARDALKDHNEALIEENVTLNRRLADFETRLTAQDLELASLRKLVQGVDAMANLSTKIDTHHAELLAAIGGTK